MSSDHWQSLFRAWSAQPTIERVSSHIIAALKREIASVSGPVLLLGMTTGLLDACADVTAIDRNAALVRDLWPGQAPGRRAVVGDWLSLPFAPGSFAGCVGDGSLISFAYPDSVRQLLESVATCLRPGGIFVCRVFFAPDVPETIAGLQSVVRNRAIERFQIFKFRLAMVLAGQTATANVAVPEIAEFFDRWFPDRDLFAAMTGWNRSDIDTIDIYRESSATYAFPTKDQFLSILPDRLRLLRLSGYPFHQMAAQWPILVMERQ